MGKQLLLIRHAKSDWSNGSLKDFDRPLNKRGLKNAPEMADRLIKLNIKPDLMVSSTALRALKTAKLFAEKWKIDQQHIKLEPAIYEASESTLLKVINNFDDQYETIALFGHNPGITDLANLLSNGHIYNMPTCSVVIITFEFDSWQLISSNTGNVALFDYPKNGDD